MIIAIVRIPLKGRSLQEALESATKTAPTYRALAAKGLLRKDYLNGEEGGGGIYTWKSRAQAEAWYNHDWREKITLQFGAPPTVTYYECPVTVDNIAGETMFHNAP